MRAAAQDGAETGRVAGKRAEAQLHGQAVPYCGKTSQVLHRFEPVF